MASRPAQTVAAAIAVATALGMHGAASAADAGVEVGILTCENVPGTGLNLIIHSTTDIKCVFNPAKGDEERYKGETGIGLGVDLKWDRKDKITFTVLSNSFRAGTHQLAGKYAGGKASVTAGLGGGAAVLVGGVENSIGLKPALEQSKGFGVAAGLGYMSLEPDK